MYEEAEKWMGAVGRRKFMGGSAPNLADLVGLNFTTFLFGGNTSGKMPLKTMIM